MRTVNFFIIVFGTSLTYVHSKPAHSFSTRLLPNDIIRVKKRQDDSSAGYLEQCGIVTFPMAQQGVVNVLAFLDSSWPYSHRQAIMLKMLNERLQRSGLPDTLFFVVNVDPSSARTVDNAEDDIEREAWLGVSPEEIETFSDIVKTTDSLAMSMTSQMQLIQDNEDLKIWKSLRGSRDQVLVIDRCGKLTYQVIVPWSILHFPYVKAAILSTYKDEPCGPCDVTHNTRDQLKHRDEAMPQRGSQNSDTRFNSTVEEYLQNDRDLHVPDVPESDLRNVLETSTTVTNDFESASANFVSEAIDVIRETTTEFDILDSPDNYTPMNFGVGSENEMTTLESSTFITTEDITKIEPEATISTIFTDSENTDFTGTLHPINNDQTTNFQLKETFPILQNFSDDPGDEEDKFVITSTDIIKSDTKESIDPVLYYETTENVFKKDDGKDTILPETPESNTSKFSTTPKISLNFDNDTDKMISIDNSANQLDSTADNIYMKDHSEDTTASATSELIDPVLYYETTENVYTKDDGKETTLPQTPESNTSKFSTTPKISLNFDNDTDTMISNDNSANQLDSTADNIYMKDHSEDTTASATSESIDPVLYYETTENVYIKDDGKETTLPQTPESNTSKFSTTPKISLNFDNDTDTMIFIDNSANQLDSTADNIYMKDHSEDTTVSATSELIDPVLYYETTENVYIKDDGEDTTLPETPESNTSKFSTTPKISLYFDNDTSTEISVETEDTTISIDNNANQLDSPVVNIYIKEQFEDTTARETSEANTPRFFRIQENSTDSYNENGTQSSVEKEDTTISINSDTIQLDGVVLSIIPDELTTSENGFDASTEEPVTLNSPSSVYNKKESNENRDSENLQGHFDSNNENQDTSQLSEMPLRIIMHAPHFHVDGDSTRMHEYLVLKTGSSDYHRHLASYDATRLYRGPQDFQETLEYLRNDEIEGKEWPMTSVIYNKDESPGLYGEVADYWKNAGGQDNYDYTEETETSGIEPNTEQPRPDEGITMKPSTTNNANLTGDDGIVEGDSASFDEGPDKIPDRLQADFADESVTDQQTWNDETLSAEEEEKRSKLIAHYSKLLPWIYYVLDK